MTDDNNNLVELATELTIAWLGNANTRVAADEVSAFLRTVHSAVRQLSSGSSSGEASSADAALDEHIPAITARRSLASKDHIISMIDGRPYRALKRHLSNHGLTPQDYRARYKLKADYPMVAESYSEQRRAMAIKIGLGSKGRAAQASDAVPASSAKPARKPRAKKTPA